MEFIAEGDGIGEVKRKRLTNVSLCSLADDLSIK